MAYTEDHKKDTEKAIQSTTSAENVDVIKEAVHFAIDGQKRTDKKSGRITVDGFDRLIASVGKYGIDIDALCQQFFKQGVPPQEINERYNGNKEQFLLNWLFPEHGPGHQVYTHKGFAYDYSGDSEKADWTGPEIQKSWTVKRYLLIKIVQGVYDLSNEDAEKYACLLYSIHRLRDLQCNGSENTPAERKAYLFNVVQDIRTYVSPLIKDAHLYKKVKQKIDGLEAGIKKWRDSGDYAEDITKSVEELLGPIGSDEAGLLDDVVIQLTRKRICRWFLSLER